MKTSIEKTLKWGLSLALALAVLLYFGLRYPYHIRFHEQCQLLPLTWGYFIKAISVPGGLADWCGEFMVQFFLFPWVGAAMVAFLVVGVQLLSSRLAARIAGEGMRLGAYAAGFVPAALVWVFLVTNEAIFGGAIALLLSLAASIWLLRLSDWGKVAALPVAYWLFGPVALICAVSVIADKLSRGPLGWRFAAFAAACSAVSFASPLLSYIVVPYSFASCWVGIHYCRSLALSAWHLLAAGWSMCLLVSVFALLSRLGTRRLVDWTCALALTVAWVLVLMQGIRKNENMMVERIVQLDCLCQEDDFDGILRECENRVPEIPVTMAYRNLALAMKERLLADLFKAPQYGLQGLFPNSEGGYFSHIAVAEIYRQIGYASIAHQSFFEAQEATPDFRRTVRCYRALAGTNIIMGYYDGARKYLDALSKTLFHSSWAKDMERMLSDKAVMEDPVYGTLRSRMPRSFDMLFNSDDMTKCLGMMCMENPRNYVAVQYLLAFPLITCDMNGFAKFYSAINFNNAPASCSEAAAMNPELARTVGLSDDVMKRYRSFVADANARKGAAYMKQKYGTTYWYYYSMMMSRKNSK